MNLAGVAWLLTAAVICRQGCAVRYVSEDAAQILKIFLLPFQPPDEDKMPKTTKEVDLSRTLKQIGRASCRERV